MLNFPLGEIVGRVDTLEKIVTYSQPDILLIQELKTAEGLADVAAMMTDLSYGNFEHSAFVPMQSDPGNPYTLQQAIVFNQNIFKLKSQHEILTAVRDINEFVLYLNDAELPNGADTTFIYVYVTHLKSSTGTANQLARLAMVNDWIAYMDANFIGDENVIFAGDFNLYTNTESAYQALMNTSNTVVMHDVLSTLGNWTGANFAHKEILTQSTRLTQVGGDGATGGLDDRFDFILFSAALVDNANNVHYSEDSFRSLGNNATCYNQNITDCSVGNDVPYDVLRAMYYLSDHIPQVCELTTSIDLSHKEISFNFFQTKIIYDADNIKAQLNVNESVSGTYSIRNTNGQLLKQSDLTLLSGKNMILLDVEILQNGVYIFAFISETGLQSTARFVVCR